MKTTRMKTPKMTGNETLVIRRFGGPRFLVSKPEPKWGSIGGTLSLSGKGPWTLVEIADALSCSYDTVYRDIRRGNLTAVVGSHREGRAHYLVTLVDLAQSLRPAYRQLQQRVDQTPGGAWGGTRLARSRDDRVPKTALLDQGATVTGFGAAEAMSPEQLGTSLRAEGQATGETDTAE